jgi:biofilm protein TabA
MIIDKLENASKYYHMNPHFEGAFNFLKNLESKKIPFEEGNHEILGTDLFAINAKVEGCKNDSLEAHQTYIDIQYIFSGSDTFGWQSLNDCKIVSKPYDVEKDICFYSDENRVNFTLNEKCFVIFFPEDAHAPLGGDQLMEKTVMKVKVDGK